jgi:hypothetical protein
MFLGGWVDGWVGGWMGGWVGVKAVLRIAYSNQQSEILDSNISNLKI